MPVEAWVMVQLSLRVCAYPCRHEPLEAHEVVAGDRVLGRIERYAPKTPQMAGYSWVASVNGNRVWWFSKSGAIAMVVKVGSGIVAEQMLE